MNNSFKQELEAEINAATKSKFRSRLMTVGLLAVLGILGVSWVASAQSHSVNDMPGEDVSYVENKDAQEPLKEPKPEAKDEPASAQMAPTPGGDSTTPAVSTTPPASNNAVDHSAFIADGRKTIANYNQIVGLVTFTSSMSDEQKAGRIKQAVALDKQYFSQVPDLRGHLVWANVSSGPYMDATKLAEDGVSKISVGLNSMNYWADNRSRTTDLQIGLGYVGQGSNILLQFSQKLNAL